MSRGLSNWTFRDAQDFLLSHGFELHHIRGSHYYFKRYVKDRFYMTHVQYHGSKAIPEGNVACDYPSIRHSERRMDRWINILV